MKPFKPIKHNLSLNMETVRNLSGVELDDLRGGLDPVNGADSVDQCRTQISCSGCSELQCPTRRA